MKPIQSAPAVLVELDGVVLDPADSRSLGEVRVQQRLSLPTLCELRFFDPQGPLGTGERLPPGAPLRVSVHGHDIPLFDGEVTAAEYVYGAPHGRELRVRGYDLLHRLRKRQPIRAHVNVNLLTLARELVADLGITVAGADVGPVWPKLFQHRHTDFDMLADVADRTGLHFSLREDVLHLISLEGMDAALPLQLGDNLLEAQIEVNGDPACRNVSTSGWNPLDMKLHPASATQPRVGRAVIAEVPAERMGSSGERTLADRAVRDSEQAEALAQAELDRRVAREVVLRGTADGDPRLRPGTIVDVRGVVPALAGEYVLTSVTHLCDDRHGFLSEFHTAPPAAPEPRCGAVVTFGVVSRVDDPAGMGRIQVSLPTYGELETEWMSVLATGAGAGKGFMILPEVGDHVLVLFAQEDPAQGIVIGGLYGPHAPTDVGLAGGQVRRWTLLTPGGQRFRLDDDKGVIQLENKDGSHLTLGPELVRFHSNCNLEIEAPGMTLIIRAGKIDFQKV